MRLLHYARLYALAVFFLVLAGGVVLLQGGPRMQAVVPSQPVPVTAGIAS